MNALFKIVIVAIATLILEWFLPWWGIAIGAFLVGLFNQKGGGQAFLAGFVGVGFVWLLYAGWLNMQNDFLLAEKVAELFQLPHHSLLMVLTALIGALVGGLSAWSGFLLRRIFIKPPLKNKY